MNDLAKNQAQDLAAGAFNYNFKGNSAEAAQVIADELLQLRKLATQSNMRFLSYLLEMAFREAFMTSVNPQAGAVAKTPSASRDA